MSQSPLPARTTRILSPGLAAVAFILVAVLFANGLPRLSTLMGAEAASARTIVPPSQTEILHTLVQRPEAGKPGVCDARSLFAPRADAWRCTVEGTTFDPCFETHRSGAATTEANAGDAGAIVCGAEPLSGAPGFFVRGALPPALPTSTTPPIGASALESLTYQIDLIGAPVTLTRGQFYVPWVEQTNGSVLVGLSELRAGGDLDGDGDEDQAVLLVADAADDRMFIFLGAVLNENGVARASATLPLGDRVKVDNLEIARGQILVTMTTHTGDDPACCPTLDALYPYVLTGDRLMQVVDGWRLELAGGVQCVPVQSQAGGGGMGFAYQCSDGAWLRSGLQTGQVWYGTPAGATIVPMQAVAASPTAGDTTSAGATAAALRSQIPVVRVWQ